MLSIWERAVPRLLGITQNGHSGNYRNSFGRVAVPLYHFLRKSDDKFYNAPLMFPLIQQFNPIQFYSTQSPRAPPISLDNSIILHRCNDKPSEEKPLVLLMAWMLAKRRYLDKYLDFYLPLGFDVLVVNVSPMGLMFPTTGSQVIAKSLVHKLLEQKYKKIVIHAFSVGAYQLCESLLYMKDIQKEKNICDRFVGQIYDSAVDHFSIPSGFSRAVAGNNAAVQKPLEWLIKSHMALSHKFVTKHYLKASETFHDNIVRCPALFFVSEDDIVGNPKANEVVANKWKNRGVDVSWKCWKNSAHVSHMHFHKDEYTDELTKFLKKIGMLS